MAFEEPGANLSSISKDLSDIKANLAVNSSETANIKGDVKEIKTDIKEIKNDFPSRRELNETANTLRREFTDADQLIQQKFTDSVIGLRKDIAIPKKILYALLSAGGVYILYALLDLIISK